MITDFVKWLIDVYGIDVSEEAEEFNKRIVFDGKVYNNKEELMQSLTTMPVVIQNSVATIGDVSVPSNCNRLRDIIINKILRKI